jgi:16S rRNA (guanine966-N2)-methyltransferase
MRKPKRAKSNQVRIIGGIFRSRKLAFPALPGLRPTGDRIRETLFNWLAPYVVGSRCLDLFAGSGALGIEALSRGAAQVTFMDASVQACDALRSNLNLLDRDLLASGKAQVICTDSLLWLDKQCKEADLRFNIVFLDSPFDANLNGSCISLLDSGKLLASGDLIYIEEPRENDPLHLLAHWQLVKTRDAGNVRFQLFQRE